MPTYVYKRKDGTTFEVQQSIKADALTVCPTTGQPVSRIITGSTGLIFKGSGFYHTDYVRNNPSSGKAAKSASNGGGRTADSLSSSGDSSGDASTASSSSESKSESSASDTTASSNSGSSAASKSTE